MRRLSRAVEYRDEETGGHTERMSAYSAMLAGKLGLDVESIRIASPMHDVGKVALPDHILLRPGALTPEERARWSATPIGYQILSVRERAAGARRDDRADPSREVGRHRYPRQLAGNAIPLEARWRPSPTCSTRSPATVPTGRRSPSSRRSRLSAAKGAGISTPASWTCSSRTSTAQRTP